MVMVVEKPPAPMRAQIFYMAWHQRHSSEMQSSIRINITQDPGAKVAERLRDRLQSDYIPVRIRTLAYSNVQQHGF
jgi:hypothetical protein